MSWDYCKHEGCSKFSVKKGWCNAHYLKYYKTAEDYKPIDKEFKGEKRNHPLYMLWFERKQCNLLCEEWLDFKVFIENISPKPEGYFFLVRLDANKPFSPNNFKWIEKLKRLDSESTKDWNARKLEARKSANPNLYSDRNLKRKFGLNRNSYNEKLKLQNYVCAICEKPESSFDSRTNTLRRLAVDHCHTSGKIRDLLCWRCNGTIGKIEEDLELLHKMIKYLEKHKG